MKAQDIKIALAAYTSGHKEAALEILASLATRELRHSNASPTTAVDEWIALACDRIRSEMGQDVVAICPVRLALGTAISLLDSGMGDVCCPDPGALEC